MIVIYLCYILIYEVLHSIINYNFDYVSVATGYRVNSDIPVKWVAFSPGHTGPWVKLKKSEFIILSNIAVTIILLTVLLESIDRFIINV